MPVKTEWKPTIKQARFLSLPLTLKEGFYGGGAGSAKTDVLLMYGIVHKWHEHPLFKQVLMRRTLPEIKREIVPRSRDIYPRFRYFSFNPVHFTIDVNSFLR